MLPVCCIDEKLYGHWNIGTMERWNIGVLSPLRNVGNSMIFRCLTPDPKGEHLKIIELGRPPMGNNESNDYSEQTQYWNIGVLGIVNPFLNVGTRRVVSLHLKMKPVTLEPLNS